MLKPTPTTDPSEAFKERMQKASCDQLPNWKYLAAPAIYFDPFFAPVHLMLPHFWKHFRFAYQKEHRLVWLPPTPDWRGPSLAVEHIWFEIGPITDCAKLVWLRRSFAVQSCSPMMSISVARVALREDLQLWIRAMQPGCLLDPSAILRLLFRAD